MPHEVGDNWTAGPDEFYESPDDLTPAQQAIEELKDAADMDSPEAVVRALSRHVDKLHTNNGVVDADLTEFRGMAQEIMAYFRIDPREVKPLEVRHVRRPTPQFNVEMN